MNLVPTTRSKLWLVTGAAGFVGRALCAEATGRGHRVRRALRTLNDASDSVEVGNVGPATDWQLHLIGIDVVVHLAARVHVMIEVLADPLAAFRQVNVEGTLNLARQAAAAGVQRFIFISSVKVNGEESDPAHPFAADEVPAPSDPYGISKMEAENGLRLIAAETGIDVVIIRPPLVYGPGVKANFHNMMRWLDRGIPLPLGAISNRRSMVGLGNLVDMILLCCEHPAAANQTFMVSDGEDISTTELLQRIARALARPARLISIPQGLLFFCAGLVNRRALANRLCGYLQVDISKTQQLMGWHPPVSVNDGLQLAADEYRRLR